jgi:hypothetical protein
VPLRLGTVVHGYKDAWTRPGPAAAEAGPATHDSGSCNLDAVCAEEAWQAPKRGVIQLLVSGFAFCSGSLVTTTARDCRPYVLTAAHCVGSAAEATATTVRFNHERDACGSDGEPPDQTLTGMSLLALDPESDSALLALDEPVPADFDPFFNGWDRSGSPVAQARCIHHPSGDLKKLAIDDDGLVPGSKWGSDHWRVKSWDLGTTEAGSSGAPLFDSQGRIVGQLHGGTASCRSTTGPGTRAAPPTRESGRRSRWPCATTATLRPRR